jgi:hypothetical protein
MTRKQIKEQAARYAKFVEWSDGDKCFIGRCPKLIFVKEGRTAWTGVRNFQARNNLRALTKGDLVFFYQEP